MLAVYNCMFWVYLGLSGLNSLFYTDWTTLVKQNCHKAIHLTKQLIFACDHVMHGKTPKPVKANGSRPICIHTEVILKARQYKWHMKRPKKQTGFNTAAHSDTHQKRSFKQDFYFPLQLFPFCFLTLAKLLETCFGITQVDEFNNLSLIFLFFR